MEVCFYMFFWTDKHALSVAMYVLELSYSIFIALY